MAVQPRRSWFQPMARQAAPVPVPAARPAAPSAPAPRPPIVRPALPSQTQEPNPPSPLAAASPSTDMPAALAAAPPRSPVAPPAQALPTPKSPVAPPAPAPSTPRSPVARQPVVNISPSASKSPTIPKPIATATRNGLVPGQAATPASSPKIAKTKAVVSRPPSPLTLPPAQIKTESAHETIGDGEKRELKKDKVANKKLSDSEEGRMSVMITLAGENKGAVMEFGPSPNNTNARSELVRYKDKFNKAKAMQSTPMAAIINSNFQGVNNAILHDRTFTHQDPENGTGGSGIH